MIRFFAFLLAGIGAAIGWLLLKGLFRKSGGDAGGARWGGRRRGASTAEHRGTMVRCENCDLHVPEERAIDVGGRRFCSEKCSREAGA